MTIEIKEVPAILFFVSTHETTIPEIAALSMEGVGQLYAAAETRKLKIAGPIQYLYDGADGSPDKIFTLRLALPLSAQPEPEQEESGAYAIYETPEFRCLCMDYRGACPASRKVTRP